jgi:zinc transport system substrate-binding protein
MLAIIIAGSVAAYQVTKKNDTADEGKLSVTASYYPLYDFARQVGGDKVTVVNMTPAGAEPHDYEPSPQALMGAQASTVFIYNGGLMEPWVDSFLSDYKHTVVKASEHITLEESHEEDGHTHADEDDHAHDAATDPHFWLDPVLAQQIVNNIRDGLTAADPDNQEYYAANASSYNQKLAELNTRFTDGLAHCTLHTAISSHGAFSYLAHRYGFTVASIAGIEPEDEPSPAKIAELTDMVRQTGIRYIFFESLVSPRLAETIASETGASTLIFDPIEGLSTADQAAGKDYIGVQYDNLDNLRKALECQ